MPYFAALDIPAIIGVLTGFCLVVVVPIVSMLLTHQRRMAELLRGANDQNAQQMQSRIDHMESEIAQLRQQLAENILAFDDRQARRESIPPPMPERLSNG